MFCFFKDVDKNNSRQTTFGSQQITLDSKCPQIWLCCLCAFITCDRGHCFQCSLFTTVWGMPPHFVSNVPNCATHLLLGIHHLRHLNESALWPLTICCCCGSDLERLQQLTSAVNWRLVNRHFGRGDGQAAGCDKLDKTQFYRD